VNSKEETSRIKALNDQFFLYDDDCLEVDKIFLRSDKQKSIKFALNRSKQNK